MSHHADRFDWAILWIIRSLSALATGLWLIILAMFVIPWQFSPFMKYQFTVNLYLEWSIVPAALLVFIAGVLWLRAPRFRRPELLGSGILGALYCLGWLFIAFVVVPAFMNMP